jgi:hypothetical protein
MLNECNDLVKKIRMASERIKGNEDEHVAIRLVAPSEGMALSIVFHRQITWQRWLLVH